MVKEPIRNDEGALLNGRSSALNTGTFRGLVESGRKHSHPIGEWISLYQEGSSTTKIAELYGVGSSTIWRYLRGHIQLRDRVSSAIAASTRFSKSPFSGNECEGAYLAGFVEDFNVRKSGRLLELRTATTHPAMVRLFHYLFARYGHPTSSPSYDNFHGYYRYLLNVYLHYSFERFLTKSTGLPSWIPQSADNPVFQSYLAGLISAEGCIRLYDNHGHADAVLHITLNKPLLLEQLSRVIGGRLYKVQRAWRLVVYGKAAVGLLLRLNIRHAEKVQKARMTIDSTGEDWLTIQPKWQQLVDGIRKEVLGYKTTARLDYIRKHNSPHPDEMMRVRG